MRSPVSDPNKPPPDPKRKPPQPLVRSLIVYATLLLFMVWLWQAAVGTLGSSEIPYSEFKARVGSKEIKECQLETDVIRGRIEPKQRPGEKPVPPYAFHTTRPGPEEDKDLIGDLVKAEVKFQNVRPSLLTQLFFGGLMPLILLFA